MSPDEQLSEARAEAQKWREYGIAAWYHGQILDRGGLHMIARGYILPEHGRRVFSQDEALAELGIEEPKFPWETAT